MDNYHERAQKFIKSAKSQGKSVVASGGELIAYKKGQPLKKKNSLSSIFSKSAGYAFSAKEAKFKKPFSGPKTRNAVKKIVKFVDKNFLKPSRDVKAIRNAKMKEMDRQAKAGEFN